MFTWRDKQILTLGEFREVMLAIKDQPEAEKFSEALRQQRGIVSANSLIFEVAARCEEAEQTRDLLTLFLKGDFAGEFFVVEVPQDKYGNTAMTRAVMKVRIEKGYDGRADFKILEPESLGEEYEALLALAWGYMVVEGPAQEQTLDEWMSLVGFTFPDNS